MRIARPREPDAQAPRRRGRARQAARRRGSACRYGTSAGTVSSVVRNESLAHDRGATVVLHAPATLAELLGTLRGVSRVVAAGQPAPAFDLHCPMMSLPFGVAAELQRVAEALLRVQQQRAAGERCVGGPLRAARMTPVNVTSAASQRASCNRQPVAKSPVSRRQNASERRAMP